VCGQGGHPKYQKCVLWKCVRISNTIPLVLINYILMSLYCTIFRNYFSTSKRLKLPNINKWTSLKLLEETLIHFIYIPMWRDWGLLWRRLCRPVGEKASPSWYPPRDFQVFYKFSIQKLEYMPYVCHNLRTIVHEMIVASICENSQLLNE